jgi:hypothetical protein
VDGAPHHGFGMQAVERPIQIQVSYGIGLDKFFRYSISFLEEQLFSNTPKDLQLPII